MGNGLSIPAPQQQEDEYPEDEYPEDKYLEDEYLEDLREDDENLPDLANEYVSDAETASWGSYGSSIALEPLVTDDSSPVRSPNGLDSLSNNDDVEFDLEDDPMKWDNQPGHPGFSDTASSVTLDNDYAPPESPRTPTTPRSPLGPQVPFETFFANNRPKKPAYQSTFKDYKVKRVDPLRYQNKLQHPRRLPNTPTKSHMPPSPRRNGPKLKACGECGRGFRATKKAKAKTPMVLRSAGGTA